MVEEAERSFGAGELVIDGAEIEQVQLHVEFGVRSTDIVTALDLSVSGRLTDAKAEDRALRRRNSSAVRSGIQRRAKTLRWPIESWPKAVNLGARGRAPCLVIAGSFLYFVS
jgi:hypothetical protein